MHLSSGPSAQLVVPKLALAPLFRELPIEKSVLRHFSVHLLNVQDEALCRPRTYSFDCRCLEPMVLPVQLRRGPSGGELLVDTQEATIASVRQYLGVHDPLPAPERAATCRVLPRTQSNLCEMRGQDLGEEFFPSVGGSIESCRLRYLQDDVFHSERTRFMPLHDIINGYLTGETTDLRLLLAAFRAARLLGEAPAVDYNLPATTRYNNVSGGVPVISREAVHKWIMSDPNSDRAASMTIRETAPPEKAFLRETRLAYQMESPPSVGELSLILRRGIDAVDVAAYTFIGGRVHLLVNREVRPALAVREFLSKGSLAAVKANSLGGVAESLEGEQTISSIGHRGAQGVREETGFEPASDPFFLGYSYTTPTAGVERAYHIAVEVDPRVPRLRSPDVEEVVDVAYIPAEDVLYLADRGVIRDPRLELSAHLVIATFGR